MSTMTLPLSAFRTRATSLFRDYAELTKLRVTSLIVMTAWCGYFFGAHQAGVSWISWGLFHSLLGIGLVSSGTAALNEVMEHDVDAHMRRTALRPLPAGRMSMFHATAVGLVAAIGGSIYLAVFTNPLTGFLGWTAARGQLEWGTLVLFAILFVWQFPHFFSIAWLYREDYANGGVKMLPVVEEDGRSTARRILIYSVALIPISLLPSFMGMAGRIYLVGAVVLGFALLYFGIRLAFLNLPPASALSKKQARQVLQATVIYLPLLFALMMGNSLKP